MNDFNRLGARERQLVETVYKLGEGSVKDIREHLSDPPGYSAVRAMLNVLVEKGCLAWRQDGNRYIYLPAIPKEKARKNVVRKMLDTFFGGCATDAIAAMLDVASDRLEPGDYRRLKHLIEQSRTHSSNDRKEKR